MAAGVRRTPIEALTHGSNDCLLVGVIIAKQTPRTFKSKTDLTERCVWNFTLRDSPANYINASFWGSVDCVENMARTFHIGDVVDIVKARVVFRKNDDLNFMPHVSSPLVLTLNENVSEMCLHAEHDCAQYLQLLRLPTRPPSDYLTLHDVHSNGQALRGQHVNLLAAVTSVGSLRQVKTKQEGKQLDCREVELMDESPTSLFLQLWDSEMAYRADNWKPRETILFMADVRLDWNAFKKSMTGTVTARTIITENPTFADAERLREYARTAPITPSVRLEQLATNFPDPATITTVMSCQTVWNKATRAESAESFTALVYAAIVELDLDGLMPLTATKCLHCQLTVDDNVGLCMNSECPVSSGMEIPLTQRVYDLKLCLADHTGSLPRCTVTSATAAQTFNCSPEEFDMLGDDAKTALKWRFLMRRCASRLVVMPATRERLTPLISILALDTVNLTDYAARLPMY